MAAEEASSDEVVEVVLVVVEANVEHGIEAKDHVPASQLRP